MLLNNQAKMCYFIVLFITSIVIVYVNGTCTETIMFFKALVDKKPTHYAVMETLDSKLDCSKFCQDFEYCTGFSYKQSSWRCELYDQVMIDSENEKDPGTVTYMTSTVCEPPPNIENGSPPPNQIFPPGYLMVYNCAPGSYQNSSMVCLKNRKWNTSAHCQFVKTCDEAATIGVTIGSTLTVKPIATMNPVSVKCEHSDTGGYWTVIETTWDNSSKIEGHAVARSGVYNVEYNITLDYIGAIADASTYCTQYVKAICTNSHLMRDNAWKMRNGELADYFFGGIKGQMNCACNLDKSCHNGLDCNCNADDYTTREDEGWSTYKDDLPITVFLNGDTDNSVEYYYLNIGSLRCRGVEKERRFKE